MEPTRSNNRKPGSHHARVFHAYHSGKHHIFAPGFLLTKDKTWRGVRPFRTYYGFKYEGGFSDHLPLTVDFLIRSQIKR